MNQVLQNGTIWKTVDGMEIHAHGGHIIYFEGYYYWYGEDRRDNIYVSCYRSKDLLNWEFRNHVLTTKSKTERYRVWTDTGLTHIDTNNTVKKVNIERPKVLYNKLTKKFIMWMHYENGINYSQARCALASCTTPDGDFTYHGSFQPYGYMSRDCTLFQDEDDTAYFISSTRGNADLHVYRLTEDYMNCDKFLNVLYHGESREAPAVFKKDGLYYLISSHCTGWKPNQGKVGFGKSMDGSFSIAKNFGDETTFMTQPSFILPISKAGKTHYLYFSDRWGGDGDLYFTSSYVALEIQFSEDGMPFIEYNNEFRGINL